MSYLQWALLILPILLFFYIRKLLKKHSSYWPSRGFPFIGSEVKGGFKEIIFAGRVFHETDVIIYNHAKHVIQKSHVGLLEFTQPVLFITDLDFARQVFVKDFDSFVDRRKFLSMEETDPIFHKGLFFMEGEPWKELRAKMSPTFTTGKIRRMFEIFDTSSTKLVQHLGKKLDPNTGGVVDFVEAYGRYTMDVIASAAFGLDSRAFAEENSVFQEMGKKMQLEIGPKMMMVFMLMMAAPKVAAALDLGFTNKTSEKFFTEVILSAIQHREKSGEKRDDFLQLMLEARNGQLKAVDEAELSEFEKEGGFTSARAGKGTDKVALTDDVIIAQSVLFILAGFDTTQSLLQFVVWELAVNPDVQEKLASEIEKSLKSNDGKFTYDSVNHLEYLDHVVNETLRKYPPVPRLERRAMVDYKIPDTNLVIPQGALVAIPTYCFHHDEEYFPNPERFDPERFTNENKSSRHPYAFQPFGHGPRNCIGMRFALTNAKMAIANIVNTYELVPCEKTLIPMKFARSSSLKPKDLLLGLKPRRSYMHSKK